MTLLLAAYLASRHRHKAVEPPAHEQEIDDLFAAVDIEASADFIHLLRLHTHELIARQVPVRDIRAAPTPRVARIAFSNGVIVLTRTKAPGDLVMIAKAMSVTSVTLSGLSQTTEGPMLRFVWTDGHSLDVFAVGLDQAD